MRSAIAFLLVGALALAGCAGDGAGGLKGNVAGIVFDRQGVPVRDARVFFEGNETRTNSNGVYRLEGLPEGDRIVRVEVQNAAGTPFVGSNVVRVLPGETVGNHNVAVYRQDRVGSIEGTVTDSSGSRIRGARVFVKAVNQGADFAYSSSYGITDSNGHYEVRSLNSQMEYDVQVNALDYNSDFDVFMLANGERKRLDFRLPDPEDIVLDPPTDVFAVAWTSPPPSRDARLGDAVKRMKALLRPGIRPVGSDSRVSPGGGTIEVDVLWTPIFDQALLGFGMYRAAGSGSYRDIAFLRDPLAEIYADMDDELRVGTRYHYRVSSVATIGEEGSASNPGSTTPIGDLTLRAPIGSQNPTFRWNPVTGGQTYWVTLFADYPTVVADPIWVSAGTASTSTTYDGPSLAGGTYYYIVSAGGPVTDVPTDSRESYSIGPVDSVNVP